MSVLFWFFDYTYILLFIIEYLFLVRNNSAYLLGTPFSARVNTMYWQLKMKRVCNMLIRRWRLRPLHFLALTGFCFLSLFFTLGLLPFSCHLSTPHTLRRVEDQIKKRRKKKMWDFFKTKNILHGFGPKWNLVRFNYLIQTCGSLLYRFCMKWWSLLNFCLLKVMVYNVVTIRSI